MSTIVKIRDKAGRVYAYEQTAIWDPEKGQSRPKRKYLGRYDEETDTIIPSTGRRGRKKASETAVPTTPTTAAPAQVADAVAGAAPAVADAAPAAADSVTVAAGADLVPRAELEAAREEAARMRGALSSALEALRGAERALEACLATEGATRVDADGRRAPTGIMNRADMLRHLTEQQRGDYAWFKSKMPELYDEHGHCFAIISDRRVLGTYPTYGDAVGAALEVSSYGKFIVQEVGPDESAYTAEFTSTQVLA